MTVSAKYVYVTGDKGFACTAIIPTKWTQDMTRQNY